VTSDEGLNAYGASTWGQFFVYQGFNAHAGWMHTSSTVDNVDEFAEKVTLTRTGPPRYSYGKELRPLIEKQVTLSYRQPDGTLAKR
ncbi:penicillin acylase family protein, partial [Vibrio parahaemolyticus]